MTIRTRVLVEGDPTAAEAVAAALRSAGLPASEVALVARHAEVTPLPIAAGSWAALRDIETQLAYADWRHEILSHSVAAERCGSQATDFPGSETSVLCHAV